MTVVPNDQDPFQRSHMWFACLLKVLMMGSCLKPSIVAWTCAVIGCGMTEKLSWDGSRLTLLETLTSNNSRVRAFTSLLQHTRKTNAYTDWHQHELPSSCHDGPSRSCKLVKEKITCARNHVFTSQHHPSCDAPRHWWMSQKTRSFRSLPQIMRQTAIKPHHTLQPPLQRRPLIPPNQHLPSQLKQQQLHQPSPEPGGSLSLERRR